MENNKDGNFPITHWTLVKRLKDEDEKTALKALDELCAQYHYPLYCYIRRRGMDHHDAQDALQEFMAKLLRVGALEKADEQKGRLRAMLATALHRFLCNWHRDRAREHECFKDLGPSPDGKNIADRYSLESFSAADTPDRVFERKWAQELLRHVLERLGEKYKTGGKVDLFRSLKPVLLGGGSLRGEAVSQLAESLGMKETNLRVAHSRLLSDYRKILEAEVRNTVATEGEIKEEIGYLRSLFSSG